MPNFGSHISGPIRHTTRTPDQSERGWFQDLPVGMNDPDFVHDFVDYKKVQDYNTTDWTLSSSGTGGSVAVSTSSSAVATGASLPLLPVLMGANYGNTYSGTLLMQTGSTAGNYSTIQNKAVHWLLDGTIVSGLLGTGGHPVQSSKKMWFECAFTADVSAPDVGVFAGISDTQANPVVLGQNYVGFKIVNGGSTINFVSSTGGVVTSSTSFSINQTNAIQLTTGSMLKLGFVFTGNNIQWYASNGSGRNFVGQFANGVFPTAPLTTTFQIQTNSANNRAMLVDYFYGCRVR